MIDREKVIEELRQKAIHTLSDLAGELFRCGIDLKTVTHNDIQDVIALLELLKEQNGKDINVPGKWISVKDRLPDAAGYECLVCAVIENYNQTRVFTAHTGYGEPGWWTGNVHYMARVQSPSDCRVHPALKVTHWMPLPEPPKEEKDETD